jgi:PAS domain S-box-containing protein
MNKRLRVLIIENSQDDTALVLRALEQAGYDVSPESIRTETQMLAALREKTWDLILCDYKLPLFPTLQALDILKASGLGIPLIVLSQRLEKEEDEEGVVACLRAGASDFVSKDKLGRLGPIIERELKEEEGRSARTKAEKALLEGVEREKMAQEMINRICSEPDLGSILRQITENVGRFSQADRCRIWLYDADTEQLLSQSEEFRGCEAVTPLEDTSFPDRPIGAAALNPAALIDQPDVLQVEGLTEDDYCMIRERGVKSLLQVPIFYKGRLLGTLRLYSVFEKRVWNPEIVRLVQYMAAQAAVAIYQAKTLQDLKDSEARKAGIMESSLDAIITMDHAGKVSEWNASAERILGYRREEALGRDMAALIIPERYREAHHRGIAHYLATGEGPVLDQLLELPALRADGTEFMAELSITRLPVAGSPMFTGTLRDITQRKQEQERIEQIVAERTAQLQAVNKELEAFSYSVSHDLRAPLRGIDGFSQALLEGYSDQLDDRGKHYLDRIRQGSQQMGKLIDDMLQLSRLTRGDMTVEAVDLSMLAKNIARDLREQEPERRVTFVIAEDVAVQGDKRLLQAALQNLLDNAWKYTSKHPEAHIEFGVTEQDGQPVYFVRDDGAGFDMAYSGKLFGAFQRLHGVGEFPGTGVGLATVARIVHRHGGRVWVQAEVEKGATFYFTLGALSGEASPGETASGEIGTPSAEQEPEKTPEEKAGKEIPHKVEVKTR